MNPKQVNFIKIPNNMFTFNARSDSIVSRIGCNGFTLYIIILIMHNQKIMYDKHLMFTTKNLAVSIADIAGFNIKLLKSQKAIVAALELLSENKLIKIDNIYTQKSDMLSPMAISINEKKLDYSKGFEMIHIDIIKDKLQTIGSNLFTLYCYLCTSVIYSSIANSAEVSFLEISTVLGMSKSNVKRLISQITDNSDMLELVKYTTRGSYITPDKSNFMKHSNVYEILSKISQNQYHVPIRKAK